MEPDKRLVSRQEIMWNETWHLAFVLKPTDISFSCLYFSSDVAKAAICCSTVDVTVWQVLIQARLSVTHLCAMRPSNKYICFPFVQFIELSEMSGPARPQIGPVKQEMERGLAGPSPLHHRRASVDRGTCELCFFLFSNGKKHRY